MDSVTRAVAIAGVIVAVAFFGWGLIGVLTCFAISIPIIIVVGILLALLEMLGK